MIPIPEPSSHPEKKSSKGTEITVAIIAISACVGVLVYTMETITEAIGDAQIQLAAGSMPPISLGNVAALGLISIIAVIIAFLAMMPCGGRW
ncbi:MAG: hypothetical protein LUQ42_05660 [Methanomicrobiales archaeon]|jgi:UPF0716 family protein affecting phage T7 exclusion|nr:hypothetical protein [Methanomicrobiales archaeon]